MAKTLLNAVNEILVRVGNVHGDTGLLASLTSSARQRPIDIAIQVVNEGIDELYTTCRLPLPLSQAESTITLVASDRDYSLASDLVQMRWPLIDKTNAQYIHPYPGGYNAILVNDPEQDDTGLPYYGAISPVDGTLYLDRLPTSADAGRIYTYQYDKDLVLTDKDDTVPFNDTVFRAMVPAWAQLWRRDQQKEFDAAIFRMSVGRAAGLLSKALPRDDYNPRA
jgi:hypothetical protein